MPRKICIVTGTRAEWGLLSPIAGALGEHRDVELQIVATNMHLLPRYGMTVSEIIRDGFTVDAQVPMPDGGNTEADVVRSMSVCMAGMADAFERLRPHMVVILGDRTEMLATASAAAVMRIPIAHISGGEITEGAVDDCLRHAITKLSWLHLTSTEAYRRRVIQLGEDPRRVINTGSIGVWNAMNQPRVPLSDIEQLLDMTVDSDTLFVTYHPATLDDGSVAERCSMLLEALDCFPTSKVIFSYPNNDARGAVIIRMIEEYGSLHPERVRVVKSLGMRRYLSLLPHIGAVVGNSSSGIIEVPSAGIPTVDIGIRQRGRIAAESVIHCSYDALSIRAAIEQALSPRMRSIAAERINPYFRPDTLKLTVDAIVSPPEGEGSLKQFYDNPIIPS